MCMTWQPDNDIAGKREPKVSLKLYLALEGFHRKVDDHVGFQGLLLDEGLEADMALKGPDTGMDQHVPP